MKVGSVLDNPQCSVMHVGCDVNGVRRVSQNGYEGVLHNCGTEQAQTFDYVGD